MRQCTRWPQNGRIKKNYLTGLGNVTDASIDSLVQYSSKLRAVFVAGTSVSKEALKQMDQRKVKYTS